MLTRFGIVTIGAVGLTACGTLSQTSAPTGDRIYLTHSAFHDNLDDLVRHYMQRKQVSGISIAIIHKMRPSCSTAPA